MNQLKYLFYIITSILNTLIYGLFSFYIYPGSPVKSWSIIIYLISYFVKNYAYNYNSTQNFRDLMDLCDISINYHTNEEIIEVPNQYRILAQDYVGQYLKKYNISIEIQDDLNHVLKVQKLFKEKENKKIILHIHGGYFMWCSYKSEKIKNIYLRNVTDSIIFTPNYRLAPEYPFPYGIIDCLATYLFIIDHYSLEKGIFLSGNSAGANMCISLLYLIKESNYKYPTGCSLISPMTNYNVNYPSSFKNSKFDILPYPELTGHDHLKKMTNFVANISDDPLKEEILKRGNFYCDSNLFDFKLISCINEHDFEHLPPILIQVGEKERLLDDSIYFTKKVFKYQKNNKKNLIFLNIFQDTIHIFEYFLFCKSTKKAYSNISDFMDACCNGFNDPYFKDTLSPVSHFTFTGELVEKTSL